MRILNGKVAVVTGGATGIGKALALALAGEGMAVAIASTNIERLEAAATEIRAAGGAVATYVCDVTDRGAVRNLAASVTRGLGAPDLVCANAGVTTFGPFLDHADADWDWVIDVVLRGVTNCVQAFYPLLAEKRAGHLMITGSQTAYCPDWVLQHGPYVAAKGAVHALALALRAEAAELGVEVSLLVPAATRTDVSLSARSRPGRYGSGLVGQVRMREDAPKMLDQYPMFIEAEEAARRAIHGVKTNAAITVTHPGMKPLVDDYLERIAAAYDLAANYDPLP